jgi:hypothetical protein
MTRKLHFSISGHGLCEDLYAKIFFESHACACGSILGLSIFSAGRKEKKGNKGEKAERGTHDK